MLRHALVLIAMRFRRNWPVMLGLSVFATVVAGFWWKYDLFEISDDERGAYDDGLKKFTNKEWFPWGKTKRSEDILVVAIDDETFAAVEHSPGWFAEYGSWPFDRKIYSDTFAFMTACGAKQILFDAFLDAPRTSDKLMADVIKNDRIPFYVGFNMSVSGSALPHAKATNLPLGFQPLPTIEAPPVEVDAGAAAEEEFEEVDTLKPTQQEDAEAQAKFLQLAAERMAFPVEFRGGLSAATFDDEFTEQGGPDGGAAVLPLKPVPPIKELIDVVAGMGIVKPEEDEDGKMRKTRFAYSDGVNTYATLPVAMAADALGADRLIIEPGKLTLGNRTLRIDQDGSASLDFQGKLADRYRTLPLVNVLRYMERNTGCEDFKGKYIFVGGFAAGTSDNKATPLQQSVPGVIKQLVVFDSLMHGQFITDAPFWVSLLFTFLVALFSVALVLAIRNVFVDIGWPVVLWAGFFLLTGSVLTLTKIHVLSALPAFAGTIGSVLATAWERLIANKDREKLKERFANFMEPNLVERMVENPELPNLGGELMHVTAFFSDIKGFSTFSEKLREDPKKLMNLLNRYLSTVTPTLTEQGGCIDKYIGDAVVCLFGAPFKDPKHPLKACIGALEAQKAVAKLREELKKEGLPDVYTRMGVNTDTMLVGNIGSEQLIDYTAIGDGMNLAARLEATNKAYGTLILIGENTYQLVRNDVVAREVDMVRVAGKTVGVRIYELLGLKGQVDAKLMDVVSRYAFALSQFRAREFDAALVTLNGLLATKPDDGPSLALRTRCEKLRAAPPPANWDGIADIEK